MSRKLKKIPKRFIREGPYQLSPDAPEELRKAWPSVTDRIGYVLYEQITRKPFYTSASGSRTEVTEYKQQDRIELGFEPKSIAVSDLKALTSDEVGQLTETAFALNEILSGKTRPRY